MFMKRLKGLRNVFVLLVIMGLILSGCTTGGSKQEDAADSTAKKTVKVGFLNAMSGAYAAYGKSFSATTRLALEDFNKTAQVPVELLEEDAGSTPVTAKSALDKVLEKKPDAIFAGILSVQFNGIVPTLAEKKTPTMILASLPTLFQNGWNWIFNANQTGPDLGITIIQFIKEKLGKSNIAIVITAGDIGMSTYSGMLGAASASNVTIFPEFYQTGDNDYSANITSARRKNPDAYFVGGSVPDMAKIIRQMRQMGIQEPIVVGGGTTGAFLNLLDPKEVEGLYATDPLPADFKTNPNIQAFSARFKEKAGYDADGLACMAYDGAMMLFNAASKAGGDPQKINEIMHETQGYKGLVATYSFDATGKGRKDTNFFQIGPNKAVTFIENRAVK